MFAITSLQSIFVTRVTKSLQEGVLHGFFSVLGIAEDRHSHTKHPSLIHQCFKRATGLRGGRDPRTANRLPPASPVLAVVCSRYSTGLSLKWIQRTGQHEGHAPRGVPFAARPVLRDNVTDSGSTPERNEGIPRVLWPTGGEAGCGFRSSAFKNSSTRST